MIIETEGGLHMARDINVMGWESAQALAKSLTDNGYDVLIKTDGHIFEDGQRSYMIEFVHPEHSGEYFALLGDEQLGGLPQWEDVEKEELMEGLEHLDKEKVDYDTFYEIKEEVKPKKKKKGKK